MVHYCSTVQCLRQMGNNVVNSLVTFDEFSSRSRYFDDYEFTAEQMRRGRSLRLVARMCIKNELKPSYAQRRVRA